MRKIIILIVSLSIITVEVASATSKAMPLNKENVIACAIRIKRAIEWVTPQEQQMMIGNTDFSKKIITRIMVQPITVDGYDFEKTVLAIVAVVASGNLPLDLAHKTGLLFILTSIYGSSSHLVSYGLMSQSTRIALEDAVQQVVK